MAQASTRAPRLRPHPDDRRRQAATARVQREAPRDRSRRQLDARGTHRFGRFPASRRPRRRQRCSDASREPARHASADGRSHRGAARRTACPRCRRSAPLHCRCVRRRRFPHPNRRSPPPATARWRRSSGARPARRNDRARAGSSTADRASLRRIGDGSVDGPGAPRPADPIRAHADAAQTLGRMDTDRRAAGGLRAPVGRIRARLAFARRPARPRHRIRHAHARGGHFIDGRRGPRSATAVP